MSGVDGVVGWRWGGVGEVGTERAFSGACLAEGGGAPFGADRPAAEVVRRRVAEAKRDGSFGRLRKTSRREGEAAAYRVVCGGCGLPLDVFVEGFELGGAGGRAEARWAVEDAARELGWRARHVPGVGKRRQLCPGCLWDMDMEARFYLAVDKDPEPAYARWAHGSPFWFARGRGGGEGDGSEAGPCEETA